MLTEEQITELEVVAGCTLHEIVDVVLNRLHTDIIYDDVTFMASELLLTANVSTHQHYAFIAAHAALALSLDGWSDVTDAEKRRDIHYTWFAAEDTEQLSTDEAAKLPYCVRSAEELAIGRAIRKWSDMVHGVHPDKAHNETVTAKWYKVGAAINKLYATLPEEFDFDTLQLPTCN